MAATRRAKDLYEEETEYRKEEAPVVRPNPDIFKLPKED
jgi:hypothetical protein